MLSFHINSKVSGNFSSLSGYLDHNRIFLNTLSKFKQPLVLFCERA